MEASGHVVTERRTTMRYKDVVMDKSSMVATVGNKFK